MTNESAKQEMQQKAANQSDELVITRVLDAPRETVWRAWSEPEHLAQWWGPKGSTVEITRWEFRPGGVSHYNIKMPNGGALWGKFVYREIAPPERLVYVSSFANESGDIVRAPFSPVFPLEIENTLMLAHKGDATMLTLRGGPVNATAQEREAFAAMRMGMQEGFGGMLDVLAAHLANA